MRCRSTYEADLAVPIASYEVKDAIGTARSASYVDIHLIEHEVKDAIGTARSASYVDIHLYL
jgi:hypothetical protein